MRAGCFAETRVIHLLNRRFVPFYYNTGGPGLGKDPAAAEFVLGKVDNKWAFFAAFDKDGDPLGVTDIYANKDGVFEFLVNLLKAYPECDKLTKEEEAIVAEAKKNPSDHGKQVAAGILFEELGRYEEATVYYRRVIDAKTETSKPALADAWRGMLRMTRYNHDWKKLETMLAEVGIASERQKLNLEPDLAMERGYLLRERREFAKLRQSLEDAIRKYPQSPRMGEFRFYAGVACFFQEDLDWAWYHWCWVVENIPEDHMNRRCAIAAAHQGMPYDNPELDGFKSPEHFGSIERIQAAYDHGLTRHLAIKPSAQAKGL